MCTNDNTEVVIILKIILWRLHQVLSFLTLQHNKHPPSSPYNLLQTNVEFSLGMSSLLWMERGGGGGSLRYRYYN